MQSKAKLKGKSLLTQHSQGSKNKSTDGFIETSTRLKISSVAET